MGIFDQLKSAGEAMKNMNPGDLCKMVEQAKETQKILEDLIKRVVDEEIIKRGLISREEAKKLLNN